MSLDAGKLAAIRSVHTKTLILLVGLTVLLAQTARSQEVISLTVWKVDPFKSGTSAEVITSSTPLAELPGARAKVSMACRRTDGEGKLSLSSTVDFELKLSGTSMDVITTPRSYQVPHTEYRTSMCPFGFNGSWVPCNQPETTYTTEYTTDYSINWTERIGQEKASDFTQSVGSGSVDSLGFSRDANSLSDSSGNEIPRYLLGFTAHHTQVALQISPRSPVVAKFLRSCQVFSPEQERLKKDIAEKQAAETAAEVTRQEQARIAQAKAAEQARLAAEQDRIARAAAAEALNARIAARQKRRDDAIMASLGEGDHVGNQSQWATLLVGKTVVPTVVLGRQGKMRAEAKWSQAKTEVFPSGKERFVISEIPFGDIMADQYTNYPADLNFVVKSVEFKKDCLEIKLEQPLVTVYRSEIKLMLGKEWQTTKSAKEALTAVEKTLTIAW